LAKEERFYSSSEGAYATRVSLATFRTKVSKLGIKGKRQGQKVFYTKQQLQNIYDGVPAAKKAARAKPERKAGAKPKKA
jgi:hypothetical protein